MNWLRKKSFLIFFLLLTATSFFIFNKVFVENKVLLSSNLLASFYSPWSFDEFEGWEGGIPNKAVGIDDLRIFYPQRAFTIEMINRGEIPHWNPYNFAGNTHLGLSETGVFYPLSFIFFILPQIDAWNIMIMLQPLIAGIGMYLFLSKLIVDKRAVVFGALVFAFSGLVMVRAQEGLSVGHTLIWFPYVLYGMEAFVKENRLRYLFVSLSALVFSFLSGWFQFFFYIYVFSFIFFVFRANLYKKEKILTKKSIGLLIFLILPLLVLYQLLPALETLLFSPRGDIEYDSLASHLMPIQHLITLIFPDFFGNPGSYNFFGKSEYKEAILNFGLIPLIFSLFAYGLWKKTSLIKFFIIFSIIPLILGTSNIISEAFLKLPIPIVSSFLPNRIFLISTFSLIVLSACGLEYFLSEHNKKKNRKFYVPIIVIALLMLITLMYVGISILINYLVGPQNLNEKIVEPFLVNLQSTVWSSGLVSQEWQSMVQFKNIIIPAFIFLVFISIFYFRKKIKMSVFITLIFILTLVPQVYFAQKYFTFSEREFVFPENEAISYLQENLEMYRFISVGDGYIQSNFPLYFSLYSPDGVSSMYLKRYGELISYVSNMGEGVGGIRRIETRIDPSSAEVLTGANSYLLKLMEISGIKYILRVKNEAIDTEADNFKYDNDKFELIWENDKWEVYEFLNVQNRFFWTDKFDIESDGNLILKKIFSDDLEGDRIVIENYPHTEILEGNGSGTVELVDYTPNRVSFLVNSDSSGLLYLSDNYFPDYKARINGKEAKVLRANYTYRAVPVEEGKHEVVFYFDDSKVIYSFYVSFAILFLVIIGTIWLVKSKIYKL